MLLLRRRIASVNRRLPRVLAISWVVGTLAVECRGGALVIAFDSVLDATRVETCMGNRGDHRIERCSAALHRRLGVAIAVGRSALSG